MTSNRGERPYRGARFALVTRHAKERALAPPLEERFAASLDVVRDIDTDTLGTFTRDVPRWGSQRDAAREKARLASARSLDGLGLGSEGSFGPGPVGLAAWNLELAVLVDSARGLEVVGRAAAPGLHVHGVARGIEELEALARRARFPEHGLVLRPDHEDHPGFVKDFADWSDLERAFRDALAASHTTRVFVESDLRAHRHPSRMALIERAARDLVERLAACCPACGAPGFGRERALAGLPCRVCESPTQVPRADEHRCPACDHVEARARTNAEWAEPERCGVCNP